MSDNRKSEPMKTLMTSRFSNATWNENQNFRNKHPRFGCIYCSPCPVSQRAPIDTTMFILEMNNDENRIMGIGMAKNHPQINPMQVYKHENYNRYQFYGKHRIDRTDMTETEEAIMRVFDILCFTGNKHQKRGHGLKIFPKEILRRCNRILDLVEFITEMFKYRKR